MSSLRQIPLQRPFVATAAESAAMIDSDQSSDFPAWVAALYLFVIFSRLPELASIVVHGNAYIALIVVTAAIAAVFFSGNLLRGVSTTQGILLIMLTMWMSLSAVFGIWRGGSIAVITGLWLKSVTAFFLIAGATRKIKHAHMMLVSLGLACFLVVLQSIAFGTDDGDRFQVTLEGAQGLTLSNANGLALSLALGLPFSLYLALQGKMIVRVIAFGLLLMGLVANLRTGSRGGLLVSILLVFLVFLRAAVPQKLIMILGGGVFFAAALSVIPQASLERFKTLFGKAESADARSAAESTQGRSKLLQDSLRLTAQHPLFGVGPGNFSVAAAGDAETAGRRAQWQETHNSYTKMSSETGLPGMILFTATLLISLVRVRRVEKVARSKNLERIADMCFCLFLSLSALTMYNFFDSNALQFNLPVLAALAATMVPLVEQHMQRVGGGFTTTGPILPVVGYWRPNGSSVRKPSADPSRLGNPQTRPATRPLAQTWQTRRS